MVEPIFATMQTDNTAEHEGSSEINPTKCDCPDVADPAYNADVEMKCRWLTAYHDANQQTRIDLFW